MSVNKSNPLDKSRRRINKLIHCACYAISFRRLLDTKSDEGHRLPSPLVRLFVQPNPTASSSSSSTTSLMLVVREQDTFREVLLLRAQELPTPHSRSNKPGGHMPSGRSRQMLPTPCRPAHHRRLENLSLKPSASDPQNASKFFCLMLVQMATTTYNGWEQHVEFVSPKTQRLNSQLACTVPWVDNTLVAHWIDPLVQHLSLATTLSGAHFATVLNLEKLSGELLSAVRAPTRMTRLAMRPSLLQFILAGSHQSGHRVKYKCPKNNLGGYRENT